MESGLPPPWTYQSPVIVHGEVRHLCICDVYRCREVISEDPRSGLHVAGNWLSYRDHHRHSKAQWLANGLRKRVSAASHVEQDFIASAVSHPARSESSVVSRDVSPIPAMSPAPVQNDFLEGPSQILEHQDEFDGTPPIDSSTSPQAIVYVRVEKTLADLDIMLSAISQEILGFSATAPLEFITAPSILSPSYAFSDAIPDHPNSGPHALTSTSPLNSSLLTHEANMYSRLDLIERYTISSIEAVETLRLQLRRMICEEIRRICDIRGREWNAQRERGGVQVAHSESVNYRGKERIYFNCGKYSVKCRSRHANPFSQTATTGKPSLELTHLWPPYTTWYLRSRYSVVCRGESVTGSLTSSASSSRH